MHMMKRIHDQNEMSIFLADESRRTGKAQEICFPQSADEIVQLLQEDPRAKVTLQGGRTGVTAGAVSEGGIVINLSNMSQVISLPEPDENAAGPCTAIVQPGVLLLHLQEQLHRRGLFFPPDPTETTASLGGMVACNSSGACTYWFGATRHHIRSLEMVLADGDTLTIRRGEYHAKAGRFALTTNGGRIIEGTLPQIRMPQVKKHTAGYYIQPDMDMLDLFVGSEGTLGIVTQIEIDVLPEPKHLWGAVVFFPQEDSAIRFVHLLRGDGSNRDGMLLQPQAIEFFGVDTLGMLREAQRAGEALTDMTEIPAGCAVYTEFASDGRDGERPEQHGELEQLCGRLGQLIKEAGGDPAQSWFAFRGPDMLRLKDFRHAAPVCVNERVSEIRKDIPTITKLGTDMSVPDDKLDEVFRMYRNDLAKEGFQTSLFGHIGNNHLHCNIIPRSEEEYLRGKELYTRWAEEVVRMGGSVSAEHGIGKLKVWLLQKLYAEEDLQAMRELKRLFDPEMRLNPGNIFGYNDFK